MVGKTFVEMDAKEQAKYVEKFKQKFKTESPSISRRLDPKKYLNNPIRPRYSLKFKVEGPTPFNSLYYGFLSTIEATESKTKLKKEGLRKLDEQWYISETDPLWGEIQQKKAAQQDQVSRLLQALGITTKAINSSMTDRIEIKKYLDLIKQSENSKDPEKQKEAIGMLKQFWLDHVDTKKGRSSLYNMAYGNHGGPQFYMLPDYFNKANSVEEIQKDTTLNQRYKNILTKKLTEFLEWKKHWKEEIKLMEKIAFEQLKRDLSMAVLYKKQLRPLLENVKRLEFMGGDPASVYADLGSDTGVDVLAQTPLRMTMVKLSSGLLKKYWIFNIIGIEVTGANDWVFIIKANGYLLTEWEVCLQQRSIEDSSLKKEIEEYIEGIAGKTDIEELKQVAEMAKDLGIEFKIPDEETPQEKPKEDQQDGLRLLDRLFEKKSTSTVKSKPEPDLKKCLSAHKNKRVPTKEYDAEQKKLQDQINIIMSAFKKKFNFV